MIKSMTGYGREIKILNGREITVEIKSVNHRFFEFSARVPRVYGFLEEKLKSFISPLVSRGKVEVYVSVMTIEGSDSKVEINKALAKEYVDILKSTAKEFDLVDDMNATALLRLPDVFNISKPQVDEKIIVGDVLEVCGEAVKSFISMRQAEGERLKEDLLSRLDNIETIVKEIEIRSPQRVTEYREKLYNKLKVLMEDKNIDEQRLITEAAIFSEKSAVDEETVRLDSHLKEFRDILNIGGGCGKKLEFIVQELNRETNTIGSKSGDIAITKMVVEIKSEIEKIREQIQNIE